MFKSLSFLALCAALLVACGGDDTTEPADNGSDAGGTDTGAPDTGTADSGTPDSGADAGTEDTAPVADVFLDQVVDEIFSQGCAAVSCHASPNQNGIGLADDEGLRDRLLGLSVGSELPHITPGDVEASYLWHKVNGTHRSPEVGGTGSRMPLSAPPLTDAQLATLRAWIEGGAR